MKLLPRSVINFLIFIFSSFYLIFFSVLLCFWYEFCNKYVVSFFGILTAQFPSTIYELLVPVPYSFLHASALQMFNNICKIVTRKYICQVFFIADSWNLVAFVPSLNFPVPSLPPFSLTPSLVSVLFFLLPFFLLFHFYFYFLNKVLMLASLIWWNSYKF